MKKVKLTNIEIQYIKELIDGDTALVFPPRIPLQKSIINKLS